MPSNHLVLCHPLLLLPSIFPSIRVFFNESALCIMWPKYWSFSFSIRYWKSLDLPQPKTVTYLPRIFFFLNSFSPLQLPVEDGLSKLREVKGNSLREGQGEGNSGRSILFLCKSALNTSHSDPQVQQLTRVTRSALAGPNPRAAALFLQHHEDLQPQAPVGGPADPLHSQPSAPAAAWWV